jgi:hypothetical protein
MNMRPACGFKLGPMKRLLTLAAVAFLAVAASAQWSNPSDDIPAYHAAAPSSTLPVLLTPAQLKAQSFNLDWQSKVFADAAKVPKVLYQLPCFCRCDRALGHTSLHSCFEGTHGAVCSTCAKEGYYAYLMTKQGKTVKQIRDGIMHKEYESIDLQTIS